jgi:tetratricopeptide (TPR) repeat protein
MRSWLLSFLFLAFSLGVWAQSSAPTSSTPPNSQAPESQAPDSASPASKPATQRTPSLAPPRSDRVNANDLDDEPGESSSKDSRIDLSPPADDATAHPQSSDVLMDMEGTTNADRSEVHPWNPHKAAKDIEVGDYYFKRKNYRAAEDRYREALTYKDNDAVATFRLAVCLEKMDQPDQARKEFENYLKILPNGPQSGEAQKAIQRLKGTSADAKPAP